MNLLFILTDQQNRYALGCMDNPNIDTPHLDALAARGTLFRRCYSNDPLCGTYRGSLMTGQYAHTRMVPALGYRLSPAERTLGEAVRACGFDTAYVSDRLDRQVASGWQR